MFAASKSGSADAKDPQFNYVTMLLHGNGTNGGQNNTFTDSSTNNFTITRNGNTTQGTFSPYGSNWSNYFDGSGDYLTAPNNTALNPGTGDFTFECWAYASAAVGNSSIFEGTNSGLSITFNSGKVAIAQSGIAYLITDASNFTINQWVHIAASRSGTSLSLFVNGSRVGNATNSTNFVTSSENRIGRDAGTTYFNGYISNLRIVKGTAVYSPSSTSITVPTTPLTAITNTSLLTCADNRFIDDSTNNFTITKNGDVSVQRFSPFSPSSAYSTSVIGGSGYFDGSGDYLTAGSSISLSGDFTVEGWVYRTTTSGNGYILFGLGNDTFSTGATFFVDPSTGYLRIYTSQAHLLSGTSGVVQLNTWNHIAFVRSGTTVKAYLNGVQVDSATFTASLSGTAYINAELNGNPTATVYVGSAGYYSNHRVGTTAVYTTAFTPSTTPLTAITGTQLLLSYTNASILNNAMMNDLETVGNAQISTSVKKYGTGSMYFDGTGDWLFVPSNPNNDFSTGSFTIEMWIYPTATIQDYRMLLATASATDSYITLRGGGTGGRIEIIGQTGVIAQISLNNSISLNVWSFLTVVRNGTTFTVYVNGISIGTATSSIVFNLSNSSGTYIGRWGGATAYEWVGYIDDLRITKGYARYTANFTAPTAPFPDKG